MAEKEFSWIPIIDQDEVETIVKARYECDEDAEAIIALLTSCINDGTINDFLYDTLDTWAWENYWEVVQDAVLDWARDVLGRANNTDRE